MAIANIVNHIGNISNTKLSKILGVSRTTTSAFDHDFSTDYITPLGILDVKKTRLI